jgi:hypothetical protein
VVLRGTRVVEGWCKGGTNGVYKGGAKGGAKGYKGVPGRVRRPVMVQTWARSKAPAMA